MNSMLNVALTAARSAAKIILTGLDRIDSVRITEKSKNDFVTSVDKAAESEIVATLSDAYPDHLFLSEEQHNETKLNKKDKFWIIDPLDGTTNFIHRIPHFAISIAFYAGGDIECSLVYDPVKDELFTAVRGQGARCNQHRMRVTSCKEINKSLLVSGFPARSPELHHDYVLMMEKCLKSIAGFRRSGSAALDLAYVAAGRYDGYIDTDLKEWDVAAGSLLVRESGGYIRDFKGTNTTLPCHNIIAANPGLWPELQQLIINN
ncbi:MAG: inositol monophosphatase family protein [Pseudomonadota bacterium]|nr:inositol monophosphatase family protein [Pseudomonadota bacterium]